MEKVKIFKLLSNLTCIESLFIKKHCDIAFLSWQAFMKSSAKKPLA